MAPEGMGLESSEDHSIRLCKLDEIRPVRRDDIRVFGKSEGDDPGWADFAGFLLGLSWFRDEIVYVVSAPVCSSGSIMVFGPDISGPGGIGKATIEPSLVLATSFSRWLPHIERWCWTEYGIVPGDIDERQSEEQA